jgi:hypothetical protein
MNIPPHFQARFQSLVLAALADKLCLVACKDALTGADRYVICAIEHRDGHERIRPFGHLTDGDPIKAYLPPDMDPDC